MVHNLEREEKRSRGPYGLAIVTKLWLKRKAYHSLCLRTQYVCPFYWSRLSVRFRVESRNLRQQVASLVAYYYSPLPPPHPTPPHSEVLILPAQLSFRSNNNVVYKILLKC